MSEHVGLLVGATTKRVYAVVNPGSDEELDNPRHLISIQVESREPIAMVKVRREEYWNCETPEMVELLIQEYYIRTHYDPSQPPYNGPEIVDSTI